jgi:hypothetical protein
MRADEDGAEPVISSGVLRWLHAEQATAPSHRAKGGGARALASVLLIVAGVLGLVLSPVAIWGRNFVLDTNRYVETMAPLASNSNPGVQDALVARVDGQVEAHMDIASYVDQVLPSRAAELLAAPVQRAVDAVVHTIGLDPADDCLDESKTSLRLERAKDPALAQGCPGAKRELNAE